MTRHAFTRTLLGSITCLQLATTAVAQTSQSPAFTARLKATYYDEGGGRKEFAMTWAKRSDGAAAALEETESYDEERGFNGRIIVPREHSVMTYESFTKTTTTYLNLTDVKLGSFSANYAPCSSSPQQGKKLGESQLLGYRVEIYEQAWGKDSTLRISFAPDLDCFPLLSLLVEKGEVVTKEEVVLIEPGEPKQELFKAPSGYPEVSPLQLYELRKKRFNGRTDFTEHEMVQRDNQYRLGRSQAPPVK